jgi:site-specific DNA recombinase
MNDRQPDAAPVALYARVSTEDQAERDSVQTQLDFLRRYCELYDLPIAGEYVDDGISGTVAFAARHDGQRLIADAEAKRFSAVVFYKLSRFGRKLDVILDAYTALDALGVTIRSATEPLDTSNANGRFVFHILGAVAELDRATISENTTRGRNRVAAAGQYTGGPIPLGYDLDADKCFVPSARVVPELGLTEVAMVSDIFTRLANGETTLNRECGRLTALDVPRRQRYAISEKRRRDGNDAAVIERRTGWGVSSLGGIIRNPIYKGHGIVASQYGQIERPAPALVSRETWERANAQLAKNRQLSTKFRPAAAQPVQPSRTGAPPAASAAAAGQGRWWSRR